MRSHHWYGKTHIFISLLREQSVTQDVCKGVTDSGREQHSQYFIRREDSFTICALQQFVMQWDSIYS